ncbi:lysophospholipase L1-like esterase [Chitinophaga dinghuensis]|uniref:Lysophospholipase L1-like esterase n=1 Tax=Chitinophaga dinghuensis TaxID=1539050 RepID=A0A327W9J4_9BACT|nr:GDSL-type esterase/lipase family protein [Chitinophaga dinghuensis]RAJ87275.1 lysophospholipase L1-like esterase [Chitinophaga dinghuensis]
MKILGTAALALLIAGGQMVAAQESSRACNIVFVGNSITYGATLKSRAVECPPYQVVKMLKEKGYDIRYANCGHSGSTTVDWLPASQKLFSKAVQAADTLYDVNAGLIFSITLGTNDSAIEGPTGAPVSTENYKRNLETIVDSLRRKYPKSVFVLHRPIWYSPNTYNSSKYLQEGLTRLQTYTPVLDALVKAHPGYIFKGDRNAFGFFKKNPKPYFTAENGNAGVFYLHPNAAGAEKLAGFWADNLQQVIQALYRNSPRTPRARRVY